MNLSQVFQSTIEVSNDAVMVTDVKGVIAYVNPAWERIYGYAKAEALGSTPRLLRSGRHDAEFYRAMWNQILDPALGFWQGEVVNRTKDGRDIEVLLRITPFREQSDEIKGYMSVATDISARKQMEQQLLRQDRLVSIGLLASGLAHEIGTPLGVIRGRAEYLMDDTVSGSAAHKHLEAIVSQADKISRLMHALLNVARHSGGEEVTPVRIGKVLDEVADLLAQNFRLAGIRFEQRNMADVRVLAEPSRLEQVFLNLLINALHAVEAATLSGRSGPHVIRVEAARKADSWEISISDTGAGINVEAQRHLFKPFFTTKPPGKGTGLGLAVTHQIIHAWGGTIRAESTPGSPTVFRICLTAV